MFFLLHHHYACQLLFQIFDALLIGLMGLLEKRRYKKFLEFVNDYDPADPATHPVKDGQLYMH